MAISIKQEIHAEVASYYDEKLAQYGEDPRGVDWNGEESQVLRFRQLCKLIADAESFSVNDLGCGYGALYDFLSMQYSDFQYSGVDVAERMIETALQRYSDVSNARFQVAGAPDEVADFGIASGIFNVRQQQADDIWQQYLVSTLDLLDQTSRNGFAFNCLTSYSDPEKMRDYLYYANPGELFDLCKCRYSRDVALLHDYGLYEFTILVRKQ